MSTWIRPPHRVIADIAVPIQRLRIDWPTPMELVGIRALAIQRGDEARLVKGDGQRAQRHAVHATAGVAGYYRVGTNEATNRWIVIPHIIEQQPSVVTPLTSVVERGAAHTTQAHAARRPELLTAYQQARLCY